MKNYKPLKDGSDAINSYMVVINNENDGYHLLYGRGVSNDFIKKIDDGDASYMILTVVMESFKAKKVGRKQLIGMWKEIQEGHEKQVELINNQQENFKAMMQKFLEQQPPEGRYLLISFVVYL